MNSPAVFCIGCEFSLLPFRPPILRVKSRKSISLTMSLTLESNYHHNLYETYILCLPVKLVVDLELDWDVRL